MREKRRLDKKRERGDSFSGVWGDGFKLSELLWENASPLADESYTERTQLH